MQRRAGLSLQQRGARPTGRCGHGSSGWGVFAGAAASSFPSLFMCSAELGVGVGDCGDWVSWRGRPLMFEGGWLEGRGEGGGEAEGWGRDAPNSRESCFFGSGFASWVRAQVKSTWGPGLLSISKQASLAFFWPLSKKTLPRLPGPANDLGPNNYCATCLSSSITNTHHPAPSSLHPAPMSKQNLNSPPCAALLHPHRIASHRTAPHHSLPSTPLHSIHTQGPLTLNPH
ncbi:hypothetical protein BGZ57DRAFT_525030 [Hyaloscypha finlandica]|nr:hypothetical protein BGZ57DRAFT_525030 [Hyaloscypha finlandica]